MNLFRRQSTPSPINVGSVLNKRYRLEQQLGEGGAGIVYKAHDEQLKRTVAIKVLNMGASGMAADKLERFRSEARSVARLNHPNIITLYDYAEDNGRPYLVIEYIPGQDLWALDNSYSPNLMPFDTSLPIIDSMLAALEYSHANSVIHRDLKPENVMVTPDHQIKVMDFGLARIEGQSRLTQAGLVAGTASYLAPELALGEPGDHRVDLYAMGVIMYELLAGRRPFSDDDPLTVISQHIHAPVVPPQHYNANIPANLQAIILRLLAKKPAERYASATQVRQDLALVLAQQQSQVQAAQPTRQYPINAPEVSAERTITHQALLDRIARGKMIGRANELTQLKRFWDMTCLGEEREQAFILLSGEGGIGKTRLLRELQVYASLRDGYVLQDTAQEQDLGRPYAIFTDILTKYIQEQTPQVLRRQMSGLIAGEMVKFIPQLSEKMGYIPPNPPLKPEAERARLLEQITKFILQLTYEQPTLLLVDDLHFTDPGSLDILQMLVQQAANTSLLIVGAYRDVGLSYASPINRFMAALNQEHLMNDLRMRRLPETTSIQMLEALLGSTVSKSFAESIYAATEGNPLYIEEVVKGLAVDGQIVLKEGRWEQRDQNRLHVPGSIKAVLGQRLERIHKPTLNILQLAAAIGRNFNLDLVSRANQHDAITVQQAIDEAMRAQLIEPQLGQSYQFQHAVIRETLYEDLRPLRRRQLHRKIAAAMQTLHAEGSLSNPAVLAYHFIEGAQDEKAVPYLHQAGETAQKIYANAEAVDYFSQAREILEDIAPDLIGEILRNNLTEQFKLLSEERTILNLMSDRKRELLTLETLEELAKILQEPERQVEVMSLSADYYWQTGQLAQARQVAEQGLTVARENKDQAGESRCLEQIARLLWTQRNPDSMNYATQALVIVQNLKARDREAQLTTLVGHIYADTLHDTERSAIYFDQALKICREIGNRLEEAWTLWGLGKLALFVNDYELALKRYGEAKAISESLGATLQMGWHFYNMGDAWYNLGNFEEALRCYQEAQTIFVNAHHRRGKIQALISIGLVHIVSSRSAAGDLQEHKPAAALFEEARQLAEEYKDPTLMLQCYEALSAYNRWLGEESHLGLAIRLSNRIISLATEGNYVEHKLLGYYLRGAGFYELGNFNEAQKSSQMAVDMLEPLVYLQSPQISAAEILYRHGRILMALKRTDMAYAYLQKAYVETMRKANLLTDKQHKQQFLQLLLNRKIMSSLGSQR